MLIQSLKVITLKNLDNSITKELSKEIVLEISNERLTQTQSVTLIGSYNHDNYFIEDDIQYYSKMYALESEIAKKPTKVK